MIMNKQLYLCHQVPRKGQAAIKSTVCLPHEPWHIIQNNSKQNKSHNKVQVFPRKTISLFL